MLQKKNESLTSRLSDCEEEVLKEEQRSAELSRQVDELSHWKVSIIFFSHHQTATSNANLFWPVYDRWCMRMGTVCRSWREIKRR